MYKVSDSGEGTPLAWYPASGYRDRANGELMYVGDGGYGWSSAVSGTNGMYLGFIATWLDPSLTGGCANGRQLRCLSE